MAERLDVLWRLLATGLAFAFFGLGGSLLAATVFPPLAWLAGSSGRARERARALIHLTFRVYVRMIQALGAIRLEVVGGERLSACRGRLIVANHPTLLDVVLLMSLIPRVQCIVKHQLWENVFLRGVVRAAGYIRNDLSPEALVQACREALAAGSNLIVFPEGTRTRPGVGPSFRRGFASIATLTGTDIQLVVITCRPIFLTKGEPWYRVPRERPTFRIVVDDCLAARSFDASRYRGLSARRLVRHLEEYYAGKLAHERA